MADRAAVADALDARWRTGDGRAGADLPGLLNVLARDDHGLRWRYVPGGRFRMGSETGDPDERPVHEVQLHGFWMTEVPLAWVDYCRLMDWEPPPIGRPRAEGRYFGLGNDNKIRLQYCEDATAHARDWHAHQPPLTELFGAPARDPEAPWQWATKPMVAVPYGMAEALAERLNTPYLDVGLPTEAQWERAARGGLDQARFPWGNAPATPDRCDCDAFDQFRVLPSRSFAPNAYGLYAMTGGVAEWCRDRYDARFYVLSPLREPLSQGDGHRVLRGGSWADCADAATTSFRSSGEAGPWKPNDLEPNSPTIGFRLVLRPRT